ncbi:SH3 type 3 domain-containing protein [Sphingobacterium deserti]|uniref:SH3 type 3 domain-containing protein n=1 Tax=Sphingobacterium deserti TaxID=1229276 RepID=A0A0B8T6A9_9SPHI|nr:SH3 type 3 domain-containing protein [Sphingobacterium deserti]
MLKFIGLVIVNALSTHFAFSQTAAITYIDIDNLHVLGTCTGSANCTVCRNCSRCAHCNAGGSCGVCDHTMHQKKATKLVEKPRPVKNRSNPSNEKTSKHQDYHLKKVEINVEKANLRKGPAVDFPIITTIYQKQKLTCISNIGNWAKVQTDNGLVGFIRSDAIRISSKP